jgi:hypothetical protein
MDTQEIEISIQDTTECEDPAVDPSGIAENELVVCACGNQFSTCDEGVSSLLKKCQSCYEALRYDLEALESPDDLDDSAAMHLDPTDGDDPDIEQSASGDTDPLIPAATTEIGHVNVALPSDQLTAAMMMAISDANKMFVLELNRRKESFVYDFDPINASRSRKLFKRTSWMQKDLYWYNVFGAMHSQKGPIITPCAVELTNETVILVAILETMCNRPRYDALVYDPSTKKASIVKYLLSQFKKLNMDVAINLAEMDRFYFIFIFYLYLTYIIDVARSKSY